MSWIAQALLGVVWAAGGVAIALGPPLSETGRGASSPGAGWVFAAAGVYLIVAGFRRAADGSPGSPAAKNRRPRHATGRPPDRLTAIGQPLAIALCTAAGFGGIWWGLVAGNRTLVCFGVLMAAVVVAGFPAFADALRESRRRR